jgi:unsaturated rhamnogalacturonyl hydrolase
MKNKRKVNTLFFTTVIVCYIFIINTATAQPVVGLDNWYNCEIKAGKPFHYLWTDTAFSGYSRWGKIFIEKGARITTLAKPDAGILSMVDIYIIVDPDTTTECKSPNYIMPEEAKAIEQWVRNGGVLAMLGNDAPNCEFTHFNQLASLFGMTFNHVTLHKVTGNNFEMGASINLPDHPLFKGVSKIYLKEVSDISLKSDAKAILSENGKVLMAECRYGKGYVFAIGDPWIYNEYIDHDRLPESFDNHKAAENLTDLLLTYTKKK